jgi:tRNA A-37 threonylcarbamoyl transferase component Bud32
VISYELRAQSDLWQFPRFEDKHASLVIADYLSMIYQITRGLFEFHRYGFCHGDLNSENILLTNVHD